MKVDRKTGDYVIDEPHLKAVVDAVVKLLGIRRADGTHADWKLMVVCDEDGSKIKPVVTWIDDLRKVRVER